MGLLYFWWTFSSFLLGLVLVFLGISFPVGFLAFRFGSSLFLLRLLGFPSVCPPLAPLLGLARLCPYVLLFALRAESLLSVFSCILSIGCASCPLLLVSFFVCSDFSPYFS